MKSGIELIAEERQKQIDKFGCTAEHHKEHDEYYENLQLQEAAHVLLAHDLHEVGDFDIPAGWNEEWYQKMNWDTREERLIMAGALIAAELDRIQAHNGAIRS